MPFLTLLSKLDKILEVMLPAHSFRAQQSLPSSYLVASKESHGSSHGSLWWPDFPTVLGHP